MFVPDPEQALIDAGIAADIARSRAVARRSMRCWPRRRFGARRRYMQGGKEGVHTEHLGICSPRCSSCSAPSGRAW
jgi:hypothetical protein